MPQFNISVQPTNNENIVKFVANSFLVQTKSFEFNNIDECQNSPLAQQLFHLPFVKTVYISQNFIAIEKFNIVNWEEVQEEVASNIVDYLNSGELVIIENSLETKNPTTVYAESTPNPSVMKFVANKALTSNTFEFKNIEEAKHSPLASELFNFSFIKEIFISANYISISKVEEVEWQLITNELREFIKNYIENGKPIFLDTILQQESSTNSTSEKKTAYTDIEEEIISILNEYVKPAVESDGGNIAFDSFNEETKTVRVLLQGACSGCPSSTITLKSGIETMLIEMLDGKVTTVEAING
jgi:Fe-S cluster biogenesis protein NfuA